MRPPISEATRLKMRKARLGKAPWNKGIPFTQMIGNKHAQRLWSEKRNTGNRRAQSLLKEISPCAVCGAVKERFQMIRHHKDHNPLNNIITNLQFLCRSCHIKEHRSDLVAAQRAKSK